MLEEDDDATEQQYCTPFEDDDTAELLPHSRTMTPQNPLLATLEDDGRRTTATHFETMTPQNYYYCTGDDDATELLLLHRGR